MFIKHLQGSLIISVSYHFTESKINIIFIRIYKGGIISIIKGFPYSCIGTETSWILIDHIFYIYDNYNHIPCNLSDAFKPIMLF